MTDKMTAEQAKFLFAMEQARKAFDILDEAYETLKEVGVDVNYFQYQWAYETMYDTRCSMLLSSGINNMSLLSGIEIDGKDKDYGHIDIKGIRVTQWKMPVPREDRYS